MKLARTIFWVIYTVGTLLVAALYIPLMWYLRIRGNLSRKERLAWKFGHWWGRVVLGATGSKVKVIGSENIPSGPVVVMGNHQSYFDIMLVLGYIDKPLGFIAKKELARLPLIRQWMQYLGCLFLDRKDIRQAARVFQQAVAQIKDGWSMVIFPEGTRGDSKILADFKKGSMKLALRAQAPILPVSITGTHDVFEGNGKRIGPADITLAISPPIFSEEYQGLSSSQVSALVLDRVKQGLDQISDSGASGRLTT